MMENILILDTETTGLDPFKGAKLIEIGAVLFNLKYKQVIQTLSTLLACDENPVQDINHIDPQWTRVQKDQGAAIKFLGYMARQAYAIVAHNAHFDKKFMDTIDVDNEFKQKKWICTKNDFKWPVILFRTRLEDICNAMGVPYLNAHRALIDCTLLAECFKKVNDLETRMNCIFNYVNKNRFR
jgi:DNA polymerase III subunit epsilon